MVDSELTVGEVVAFVESRQGAPVTIGGLTMRWLATATVDPGTMEWTEVAVADGFREERGL